MSNSFQELTHGKLNKAIAELLCPQIQSILNSRGPGHCIRISDLDDEVIKSVCSELRKLFPKNNVFILGNHEEVESPFHITSTKLVELRNPQEDGKLRPPLLIFIPTSLRTSAEDSFGVATFEELLFSNVYTELVSKLLERVPSTLVGYIQGVFRILDECGWKYYDDIAKARFLMTAIENGVDGESLGASLYELTLIPDFKLFEDISLTNRRIQRNLDSVKTLMYSHKSLRGRIVDLRLKETEFQNQLFTLFERFDIQDPDVWTRSIALEKGLWSISFDKWIFKEELTLDKVSISVIGTDLPSILNDEPDAQMSKLVGQQMLVPSNRRKMNVIFEVTPHPSKINGLDHFTLQIISNNDGPVGKTKKVKVWSANRTQCTVNLDKLDKIEFREGWHYIRVRPWTAESDPVPLVNDGTFDPSVNRSNESEPFYVLPGGSIEEEPPQRAIPIEKSVEHARFKLQLIALGDDRNTDIIDLSSVGWVEGNKSRRVSRQETIIAKFGHIGSVQIPLSHMLKTIEQRILSEPKHPSGWRMQINTDSAESPSEIALSLPSTATMQSFLAVREDLFSSVRQGTTELVMEGFPFSEEEAKCIAYGEAYLDLLRNLARQAETSSGSERQTQLRYLKSLLAVDSIHTIVTDFRGVHREAVLVAPTHPLRVIWLSAWSQLGKKWIDQIQTGGKDNIAAVRTALIEGLQPSSYPVGIPVEDGRIFTPVDNLTSFWGMYAPTTEDNIRGLMAEVCIALGLPEPVLTGTMEISGNTLADKIERYLSQHPYIRELAVNVFNPGSGAILIDALVALQSKQEFSDLRYDIRLFTNDPDAPALGEALESIVNPGNSVNEATDAFSASLGNHLFSKLNIAKHSFAEFHNKASEYAAHITILLDVFPAGEISIKEERVGIAPLYGLIQDYEIEFIDDDTGTYWHKSPVVGDGIDFGGDQASFDLLTRLSKCICSATSAVATSGANFNSVPVMTLGLNVAQRELIYDVHQVSDWVFTIDRYMGVEFYDHGGKINRPDYLIDFVPSTNSQATHNLIISSRSSEEIEALLKPVMQSKGLSVNSSQAVKILESLRSLSGQLALKLISAPTQQLEALGLALARLYLEYQGALFNQIIVPLDAHTDLYKTSGYIDDVNDSISLQRTDLALFDLDVKQHILTCNLIEVKCHELGGFSEYNQLKEKISAQINQSERIIQRHFDPALKKPDRPDRLLKSRELSQLLRFYLERSIRYDIFDNEAAKEAKVFLRSIEYGYSLQFRRSALIFDFEKNGTESPETEVGIEFHRVGKDLIHALLNACRTQDIKSDSFEVDQVSQSLSEIFIPEVPKLETAAFIAPIRPRSSEWISDEDNYIKSNDSKSDSSVQAHKTSTNDIEDQRQESEIAEKSDSQKIEPVSFVDSEQAQTSSGNDDANDINIQDSASSLISECDDSSGVPYDVMLGVTDESLQYGLLGEVSGRKVALDLNHTHTISLFGVQGGGKSYTLGTVIEMATMPINKLNVLPGPLATVIFHYSPTQDYAPEFTSMTHKNTAEREINILRERYGAVPQSLNDVIILTPSNKVDERRQEYPSIDVRPIAFSASELKAAHWKFLMGAIGSQSMYLRQINLIMRGLRDNLTLETLSHGIENSSLSDHLKDLARTRLQFAGEYINDTQRLQDLIRPGRLIIVDLRDEYIEKDEALGLFVVMLQVFSEATFNGEEFNKLVVFDEAHKYIENDDLISGLVEVVREMRHKGTSIMVASQDPPSVPVSLIELSSQIIMHKFNSPAWLKHIQKANAALGDLTSEKMSHLGAGEAFIWSSKANDDSFTRGAVKIKCRPRVTQHGGGTKTAIS